MADNITAPAAGAVLATDEIGGVHYPRTKMAFGDNGSATDVSSSAPLPVEVVGGGDASAANQATIIAALTTIAGYIDGLETAVAAQSTAAKQDTAQASLTTLIGHVDGIEAALATLGTQTTLAAILAKIIAAPATEAKQDTIIGHVDGIEGLITSGNSAQATAANQTTIIGHVDGIVASLASILAKIIAAPATEAKQDALIALYTLPAGTDRSSSITTGGTAQQLAAANAARKSLVVQNISDADLWINEIGGTAAADTAGSWKVPAGSAFAVSTNRAISIIGATTGKKFTATEI